MVRQKAPCMADEFETRRCAFEQVTRALMVDRVDGNDGASDSVDEYVVSGAGVVASQRSGHAPTLAQAQVTKLGAVRRFHASTCTLGVRSARSGSGSHVAGQTPSVRTSVRRPFRAAAAAISGPIRCVRAPWP